MSTAEIIIADTQSTITLAPGAEAIKAEALLKAKGIVQVTSDDELNKAVEIRREVNAIASGVEKTREALKKPILDAGRKLDTLAKDFTADLAKERDRLDGFINFWQRKKLLEAQEAQRLAEEAQRRAEAEATRQREAAEKAEREKIEAEARAKAAEQAAKDATSKAAREKAEREAQEARQQAEAAEDAQLAAELASESVAPVAAPVAIIPQTKGVSAKAMKNFRVPGKNPFEQKKNLILLAAARPDLVNIEIRTRDVLTALNEMGVETLPGLEIFDDVKTSIR